MTLKRSSFDTKSLWSHCTSHLLITDQAFQMLFHLFEKRQEFVIRLIPGLTSVQCYVDNIDTLYCNGINYCQVECHFLYLVTSTVGLNQYFWNFTFRISTVEFYVWMVNQQVDDIIQQQNVKLYRTQTQLSLFTGSKNIWVISMSGQDNKYNTKLASYNTADLRDMSVVWLLTTLYIRLKTRA